MNGQPEKLVYSDNGAIAEVERGSKGVAIVNFSQRDQKVKIETSLPDGAYTDAASGAVFKVKKGRIEGKLPPCGTAILYAE